MAMNRARLASLLSGHTFVPWVGDAYTVGYQCARTLIVGESHYRWEGAPEDTRTWTRLVVSDWCRYGDTSPFFAAIEHALIGYKPTAAAERTAFWAQVSFLNFVQTPLKDQSERPTREMLVASEEPFREALEALQPHCVLVFTRLCWDHLPSATELEYKHAGRTMHYCRYLLSSGHTATAYLLQHPRSGFSPSAWHDLVQFALRVSAQAQHNER